MIIELITKYLSAKPFKPLQVMSKIIKSKSKIIRFLTGSHWRLWRIGVMSSPFLVLVTSRAAEFWIHWSFKISLSERPHNRLLHKSNLEETKAWISFSVLSCSRLTDEYYQHAWGQGMQTCRDYSHEWTSSSIGQTQGWPLDHGHSTCLITERAIFIVGIG